MTIDVNQQPYRPAFLQRFITTHVRKDQKVEAQVICAHDGGEPTGTVVYRVRYSDQGKLILRLTACTVRRFLKEFKPAGRRS